MENCSLQNSKFFMIITLNNLATEKNISQQKKCMYYKLTANIIFNAEKLKAFSIRSGTS